METESGLKCGVGFTVSYSPEQINPGDKMHTVDESDVVVDVKGMLGRNEVE